MKRFFWQSQHDYGVYNLGVSGDNSVNLLARFETEYQARLPEIVILAIGVNDSQYNIKTKRSRVDIEKFKQNIEQIISLLKADKREIVLVGIMKVKDDLLTPIPWDENREKCYSNENIKKYNAVLRSTAQQSNCKFIDLYDVVSYDEMEDGLHPNTAGHEKIFMKVKGELIKNKIINSG